MAPAGSKDVGRRPSPLRMSRSYPRAEAQDASLTVTVNRPRRASTIQNGTSPEPQRPARTRAADEPDSFERSPREEDAPEPPRASVDLDDLPIELVSLTDTYAPLQPPASSFPSTQD